MTFEDARRLALALPEVEEGRSFGRPSFRVRKRSFAGMPSSRGLSGPEAEETLVVRVDPLEREALLAAGGPYFLTRHYEEWPLVLVRLAGADEDEVRELLAEAWLDVAPKRLVAAHEEEILGR